MKGFLILWAGAVPLRSSWYCLSYYDISFGFFMLTRQTHDLVFEVYGNTPGIPPEPIPPLATPATGLASLIVFAIIAFRKRKAIAAWWRSRQSSDEKLVAARSEESLSSAP